MTDFICTRSLGHIHTSDTLSEGDLCPSAYRFSSIAEMGTCGHPLQLFNPEPQLQVDTPSTVPCGCAAEYKLNLLTQVNIITSWLRNTNNHGVASPDVHEALEHAATFIEKTLLEEG